MFVLLSSFPKVKNGSVFPAFCHARSTMLWSRVVMYPKRGTIAQMYHDRNTVHLILCQDHVTKNQPMAVPV